MEKEFSLKQKIMLVISLVILSVIAVLLILSYYNILPKKHYYAKEFNIKVIKSKLDYDMDGIDDYSEIVIGARKDAMNHPTYTSEYYENSYPPNRKGVCTDVIWRAFKEAGYSLKDMINKDISDNLEDYKKINEPDPNIDFRRVYNQRVFFEKYAESLTLDYKKIEEWQPGDIVFILDNHVGIISDKRNSKGIPYVIHNSGQPIREEDYLTKRKITGHYRFDASKISEELLMPWEDMEE